jgi:N-acetylmuramoyl-L-alanine amidase
VKRYRGALLALLALPLLGVERPPGLGEVVEVRHWSYPDYTRVVVELSRPVQTEVRRLPADPEAGRPERLYLDLEGVWVGRNYVAGIPVDDGLLQGVRLGQNTLRTTRLVLDLQRYQRHRLLALSHPDRIVVDVYGRRPGPGAAERTPEHESSLPTGMRPIRTVVVDPGHGGRDPGAIGIGGLREKDVTLRLSKEIGKRLARAGLRVVYTREGDQTLDLEERTALAESVGGDLFLSVHANAAPRRSVSGVETYYLDHNHERHAMNLAARENGIPRGEVNVLQRTLAKLQLEEVSPQSRRLAEAVQHHIVSGLPRKERPIDLGVKKGPFYVLFLSDMPAILVEAGFLTHKGDAKRLRDRGYLEELADQIAAGVVQFRGENDTRIAHRSEP